MTTVLDRGFLRDSLKEHLPDELTGIVLSYFDIKLILQRRIGGSVLVHPGSLTPIDNNAIAVVDIVNQIWIFTLEGESLASSKVLYRSSSCSTFGGVISMSDRFIAVNNSDHCIQVLTPRGRPIYQWGRKGTRGGEFRHPHGICLITAPGMATEIAIADTGNHRIQIFTLDGRLIRQWSNNLSSPHGIVYHQKTGEIFVTDDCYIRVFTKEGRLVRQWGGSDGYTPRGITLLTIPGQREEVITTDYINHRIQSFALDGTSLWTYDGWRYEDFFLYPKEIAYLPNGDLAVTVRETKQVHIYRLYLC